MRTRPVALALLLAFAPVAAAIPAAAQSATDDPTTEMARARFKEGVGFYDRGQFEQARASFLQAYALKKHPAVLLNLAWSSLKSGHMLEAERYFKQFLVESKDITDKQRADANDGLNQAHAKLGRIEVAAVAGTEVTIDGDKAGTTPLPDPILVEPGAHTVKFKGPDGATDTDSVTVLAGEKAIARFAKTAAAAPVAPPPTPPPAGTAGTETEAAPPPPPSEEPPKPAEKPPAKEAVDVTPHRNLLSPPETLAPVIVGGVIVLGSAAVAITMLVSKSSAQSKATDTANQIAAHGGTSCSPVAFAANTPTDLANEITQACSEYQSDNQDVNTDATIGNIALGVGIIAAIGTAIYWVVADRKGDSPSSGWRAPVVSPMVDRSTGGISLSGSF
jgi:Tfp pilus assembly protein PilF